MPLPISSAAIQEKNKLYTDKPWITLIQIDIPGVDDPVRVTSNNINTVWNGNTYVPFPFEIDEITDTSNGEVPHVDVRVSNASRGMEAYLQDYDIYCKTHGVSLIDLTISVVHAAHLDAQWVTFTLSGDNLFNRRMPLNKMYRGRCRWKKFKNEDCGYTGIATECNRTLARCRELGNSHNFGGFPGMRTTPLFV
jgi:phage-related protein